MLHGENVFYASADSIKATLEYVFNQEKQFSYQGLSLSESVKHFAEYTSDLWQIHLFCEGNCNTETPAESGVTVANCSVYKIC